MPLLFHLPVIIWMGLFELAQDKMRVPVKVKALRETRQWQKAMTVRTAARFGLVGLSKPTWR